MNKCSEIGNSGITLSNVSASKLNTSFEDDDFIHEQVSIIEEGQQHYKDVIATSECDNNEEFKFEGQEVSSKLGRHFTVSTYKELKQLLEEYYKETSIRFITYEMNPRFGASASECSYMQRRIWWKDLQSSSLHSSGCFLPFNGTPFTIVGHLQLECEYGPDLKGKADKKRRDEKRLQKGVEKVPYVPKLSKKCDCPARIQVKQVIKFPDCKVEMGATKANYQACSKELKTNLRTNKDNVKIEMFFVGRLPDLCEHKFHEKYENNPYRHQRGTMLHPTLAYLMSEYCYHNSSVRGLRDSLKKFVVEELFHNKEPPSEEERQFYPVRMDTQTYILRCQKYSRCTIEQEADINVFLDQVRSKNKNDNVHFHIDSRFSINDEPDEDEFFMSDDPEPKRKKKKKKKSKQIHPIRTYLFCYQTPFQQRLLLKHSDIAFIAKCKLSTSDVKHSFPFLLYIIVVQTAVDYQTVGSILVSREFKNGLKEGLHVFKEWNSFWKPNYIFVDDSDELENLVQIIYPDSQCFLSSHSYEEKWLDFLATPSNDLEEHTDEIMAFLRSMEYSYTEDSLSISAALFEGSQIWQKSDQLREWFQSNWLHQAKKWVRAYYPENLLLLNHLDFSLLDTLKSYEESLESFIASTIHDSLPKLIKNIVSKVTIIGYNQYVDKTRDMYRSSKEFTSLHKQLLCLKNIPESIIPIVYPFAKLVEQEDIDVSTNEIGLFTVNHNYKESDPNEIEIIEPGTKDAKEYANLTQYLQGGQFTVSFGDMSNYPFCACSFWHIFKLPCIHMLAIFSHEHKWQYEMLSPLYRCSNLFQTDQTFLRPTDKSSMQAQQACQAEPSTSSKGTQMGTIKTKVFTYSTYLNANKKLLRQCKEFSNKLKECSFLFKDIRLQERMMGELDVLVSELNTKFTSQDIKVNLPAMGKYSAELEEVEDEEVAAKCFKEKGVQTVPIIKTVKKSIEEKKLQTEPIAITVKRNDPLIMCKCAKKAIEVEEPCPKVHYNKNPLPKLGFPELPETRLKIVECSPTVKPLTMNIGNRHSGPYKDIILPKSSNLVTEEQKKTSSSQIILENHVSSQIAGRLADMLQSKIEKIDFRIAKLQSSGSKTETSVPTCDNMTASLKTESSDILIDDTNLGKEILVESSESKQKSVRRSKRRKEKSQTFNTNPTKSNKEVDIAVNLTTVSPQELQPTQSPACSPLIELIKKNKKRKNVVLPNSLNVRERHATISKVDVITKYSSRSSKRKTPQESISLSVSSLLPKMTKM